MRRMRGEKRKEADGESGRDGSPRKGEEARFLEGRESRWGGVSNRAEEDGQSTIWRGLRGGGSPRARVTVLDPLIFFLIALFPFSFSFLAPLPPSSLP